MGPGKNVHNYSQGAALIRTEPLLDAKFRPKDEARPFVEFLLNRKMTFAQCRQAILMTDDQFNWLLGTKWASPVALHELRRRRLRVWDEFVGQLRAKVEAAAA